MHCQQCKCALSHEEANRIGECDMCAANHHSPEYNDDNWWRRKKEPPSRGIRYRGFRKPPKFRKVRMKYPWQKQVPITQ